MHNTVTSFDKTTLYLESSFSLTSGRQVRFFLLSQACSKERRPEERFERNCLTQHFFLTRCSRILESSVSQFPSALPILSEEVSTAGPVMSGAMEPWSRIFSLTLHFYPGFYKIDIAVIIQYSYLSVQIHMLRWLQWIYRLLLVAKRSSKDGFYAPFEQHWPGVKLCLF